MSVSERLQKELACNPESITNEEWEDLYKEVQLVTLEHFRFYRSTVICNLTVCFPWTQGCQASRLALKETLIKQKHPRGANGIAQENAIENNFSELKFWLSELWNKFRA